MQTAGQQQDNSITVVTKPCTSYRPCPALAADSAVPHSVWNWPPSSMLHITRFPPPRPVCFAVTFVFHACSASGEDLPDSFYEFTGDDYARVARGWGANFAGPPAAAHLKTAKMRATEAAAAARLAPPIPVRVMFPNAMVLQATFVASDTVSALQVQRTNLIWLMQGCA